MLPQPLASTMPYWSSRLAVMRPAEQDGEFVTGGLRPSARTHCWALLPSVRGCCSYPIMAAPPSRLIEGSNGKFAPRQRTDPWPINCLASCERIIANLCGPAASRSGTSPRLSSVCLARSCPGPEGGTRLEVRGDIFPSMNLPKARVIAGEVKRSDFSGRLSGDRFKGRRASADHSITCGFLV